MHVESLPSLVIKALRRASGAVTAPRLAMVLLAVALPALFLSSVQAAAQPRTQLTAAQAADQVLTWNADNSMTAYKSTPESATAGPATIVFENSAATGNTTGMTHTLTFDTSTPGYNHDVSLNIIASPFDADGGRHVAQVNLTPGKYRYQCVIPGHGQMIGELVVTEGGGEDTTAPQVSAQVAGDQNAAGDYVGAATVTVSASDTESGVDTVEYALDGGEFAAYSAPVSVNQVGAHTVTFRATDKAGNTSPVGSVAFTVVAPQGEDTTPPQVTGEVTGDQDADGDYVGAATVTVTASDTGSGVDTVEYSLDGQPFAAYTQPLSVNQPGAHTLSYRATDKAGNTSPVGSVEFTVAASQEEDTTPPQVSAQLSGEQDSAGNYVGSATVMISVNDTESGVATAEYSLDGGPYTEYPSPVSVNKAGAHTLSYRATDKAGNTSPVATLRFTVVAPEDDTTLPQVSAAITGTQDWAWNYVGSATVKLTASDVGSGLDTVEYSLDGQPFAAYTKPLSVNQPGAHTLSYRATDKAGNMSVGTAKFMIVEAGGE
ncbi:Ig-like domain (group 3) [Streptosporangium subroseum]|uniref:Ig-like domain (Group 3) n=1 Tax=Streptosporangium subroseum TaxID=106412 RepID=A0A239KP27_9ACTN|nr:chitobiase/beta-hexosaminidase C-terminal domain-containing protein [Streptosporangium subroseum]SNT19428.1 Ig-like domain (group 3) [Streptosporangium subroseum]